MANRSASDIVESALGRVSDLGGVYPSGRAPMYSRIGLTQRILFADAAKVNPERFGACATAALSSGAADFNDIVDPVPTPDLIQRVEISDKGTSSYTNGDEIHIVRPEDQDAAFAPRAMIRDGVLFQAGTDLALVTSIKIYYGKMPEPIPGTSAGAATLVALIQPWDVLLEVDLSVWLMEKATKIERQIRIDAIAGFKAEWTDVHAKYLAHVGSYAPITTSFLPALTNARGG